MVHVILLRITQIRYIFLLLVIFSIVALTFILLYCTVPRVDHCYCYIDNFPYNDSKNEPDPPRLLEDIIEFDGYLKVTPNIFFVETSCRQPSPFPYPGEHKYDGYKPWSHLNRTSDWINLIELNGRQACAIESAARYNNDTIVTVLFASPTYTNNASIEKKPFIRALKSYDNINFFNVNLWKFVRGTPLQGWLDNGDLFRSPYMVSHTSDLLRFLVLVRYGGLYLDMDTITLRSMQDLNSNYVGAQSDGLAAGVINFDMESKIGQKIAWRCIYEFRNGYRGHVWSHNGPYVIERALANVCSMKFKQLNNAVNCDSVTVYPPKFFYPVGYGEWFKYFEPRYNKEVEQAIKEAYIAHVWNKYSNQVPVKIGDNSPYERLVKKHCPKVYEAAGVYL